MPKFGCCLNIGSFSSEMGQDEFIKSFTEKLARDSETLLSTGFDFMELTVRTLTSLSEVQFREASRILRGAGIPITAFNIFIPPELVLTGPDVNYKEIEKYLECAMYRVNEVGGKCIVFGSGGARRVPEGFPMIQAMEQIREFLRLCQTHASKYGIKIAIEPLNKGETNIIHTVREATEIARGLGLSNIKVLADSYHMDIEREPFEIVKEMGDQLAHVHLSDRGRHFPGILGKDGIDFKKFLTMLYEAGYHGTLSFECKTENLAQDSKNALDYVKQIWEEIS